MAGPAQTPHKFARHTTAWNVSSTSSAAFALGFCAPFLLGAMAAKDDRQSVEHSHAIAVSIASPFDELNDGNEAGLTYLAGSTLRNHAGTKSRSCAPSAETEDVLCEAIIDPDKKMHRSIKGRAQKSIGHPAHLFALFAWLPNSTNSCLRHHKFSGTKSITHIKP